MQDAFFLDAYQQGADPVNNCLGDARRSRRVVHNHGVLEADADHGWRLLVSL